MNQSLVSQIFHSQRSKVQQEKIQTIDLIWLDYYVNNPENQIYQQDLGRVFQTCFYLTDIQEYKNLYKNDQLRERKKQFVIVSGSIGLEFMKQTVNSTEVQNVFVFCQQVDFHSKWAKNYDKIKTVENNFENIKTHINSFYRTYSFDNEAYQQAFLFHSEEKLKEYIDIYFVIKLSAKQNEYTQEEKDQALNDLKYFTFNYIQDLYESQTERSKQFSLLDNLLNDLRKETRTGTLIITWYTKDTYIFRMINNTIRSKCLLNIFLIRYLIFMLQSQIENRTNTEKNYPQKLYRGTCLSINEFLLWKQQNQPFLLQGFTSTSESEAEAKYFIEQTFIQFTEEKQNQSCKVLIEIETNDKYPPLGITQYSINKKEKEYLLQLNTYLEVVQTEKQDGYYIIRTKISSRQGILENQSQEIKIYRNQRENILRQMKDNQRQCFWELIQESSQKQDFLIFQEILFNKSSGNMFQDIERIRYVLDLYKDLRNYPIFQNFYHTQLDLIQIARQSENIRPQVLELFQELLKQDFDKVDQSEQNTANNYNNIGLDYLNRCEYQKALEFFEKSLEIVLSLRNGDHIDIANLYNNIGLVHLNKKNYEFAYQMFKDSLQMKFTLLGKQNISVAVSYNNIGLVYLNQCKFQEALDYFQKDLNITKDFYGIEHIETATSYNNIAGVYDDLGQYQQAYTYYQKSLNIRQKLLGNQHSDTANSLNNMGLILINQKKYQQALEYLEKSLQIRQQIYGESHNDLAISYNNLGLVYLDQGDYLLSLEYFQKSLNIRQQLSDQEDLDKATIYNNIGSVYFKQNEYDEALKYYEKSQILREKYLNKNHADLATIYNNIALVYFKKDKIFLSQQLSEESLRIRSKIFGTDHIDTACSYNNTGSIYAFNKIINVKASKYLQNSIEIKKNINEDHPSLAITYNNLALFYAKLNSSKALENFQKSQEIIQKYNNSLPDTQIMIQNFQSYMDQQK